MLRLCERLAAFSRLALAALLLFLVIAGAAAGRETPQAGVTAAVRGNVSRTPAAGADPRAMAAGQDVFMQDRLQSAAASQAQLLLLDQSSFTVGPNSDLVIDEFVYDPATDSGKLVADVARGTMRFISGGIGRLGADRITIRTEVSVIGVRGTILLRDETRDASDNLTQERIVLAGPGPRNSVNVRPGEITVTSAGKSVTISRTGWGTTVRPGEPPSEPQPMSLAAIQEIHARLGAGLAPTVASQPAGIRATGREDAASSGDSTSSDTADADSTQAAANGGADSNGAAPGAAAGGTGVLSTTTAAVGGAVGGTTNAVGSTVGATTGTVATTATGTLDTASGAVGSVVATTGDATGQTSSTISSLQNSTGSATQPVDTITSGSELNSATQSNPFCCFAGSGAFNNLNQEVSDFAALQQIASGTVSASATNLPLVNSTLAATGSTTGGALFIPNISDLQVLGTYDYSFSANLSTKSYTITISGINANILGISAASISQTATFPNSGTATIVFNSNSAGVSADIGCVTASCSARNDLLTINGNPVGGIAHRFNIGNTLLGGVLLGAQSLKTTTP